MDAFADPVLWVFVFGLVLFGLLLGRRGWGQGLGLAVLLGFLYFLSTAPGANLLLQPLEGAYPPLLSPPDVSAIVVLSGGENFSPDRSVLSSLSLSTLARVTEAVRLFKAMEGKPTLWVVGGEGLEGKGVPLMAQAVWELGVPREKVQWLTASRNTWEDAALVAHNLGPFPFILVTSAFHMLRATACFRVQNLEPIPAPCGYLSLSSRSVRAYLPSTQTLSAAALALREYLALLWYRLRYFPG